MTTVKLTRLFPEITEHVWKEVNLEEQYITLSEHKKLFNITCPRDQTRMLNVLNGLDVNRHLYGGLWEDRQTIWRNFYKSKEPLLHLGVDFNNLAPGTSVTSLSNGVVRDVWHDTDILNGWGTRILVQDNDTWFLYGHLSKSVCCNEGSFIREGEIVGFVGNEEENGGWFPHLHLQVMTDQFVNQFDNLKLIDGYWCKSNKESCEGILDPMQFV